METSQHPTGHILVKAGCGSEWDCCDYALIDCRGWKETMGRRMEAVASFNAPEDIISFRFYGNCVDFYVSQEDEFEILPEGKDWAFVRMEEGEEESFSRPETRLEAATLVLHPGGSGFYKSYGKYTNEAFYTGEIPIGEILGQLQSVK